MRPSLVAYCAASLIASGFSYLGAAGTPAGTDIVNTARVDYTVGSVDLSDEGSASVTVAQLLAVTVTAESGVVAVAPGDSDTVTQYTVTNTGNGTDTFELVGDSALSGSDDFDPTLAEIWLDDGNGIFEPGADTLYEFGVNDPILASDASVTVFLLNDIPASGVDEGDTGDTRLTATTVLQSSPLDAVGTVYAGGGVGGVNAIVGNTQATGFAEASHSIQSLVITMTKTNEILAVFNTDTVIPGEVLSDPIPGAVITYTLTIDAVGSGTATGIQITDTVPDGTTYAAGNFKLDASPLTEDDDVDAGQLVGGVISVDVADMTGGDSHTVTFNVTID